MLTDAATVSRRLQQVLAMAPQSAPIHCLAAQVVTQVRRTNVFAAESHNDISMFMREHAIHRSIPRAATQPAQVGRICNQRRRVYHGICTLDN